MLSTQSFPTRRSSDLAKLPFYVKMFADAGFPLTSDKKVTDDIVNTIIISGNEDTVATSFTKLLAAGLEDRQSTRLNTSHLVISYHVFRLNKKNSLQEQ